MLKKCPSNNNNKNVTKNALFFLSGAPTHYSFTVNSQFLYELKRMVNLSEIVCWIFYFRFRVVLIKDYIFV